MASSGRGGSEPRARNDASKVRGDAPAASGGDETESGVHPHRSEEEKKHENEDISTDMQCGLGSWRPNRLQPLASKKIFLIVQGLVGLFIMALNSYFIGTLSTLEKRFQISSTTSGIVFAAYKLGYMVALVALGYVSSRGSKPRYMAAGTLSAGLCSFAFVVPHLVYGAGGDDEGGRAQAFALDSTNASAKVHLCGSSTDEECVAEGGSLGIPTILFVIANFLTGGGATMYFTLSVPYLDDNTTKDKAPNFLAMAQAMRVLGPPTGFAMASYALTHYVDPGMEPGIGQKDPRWIGAWWMGYVVLGIILCLLAPAMAMFPKELPRAAARRRANIKKVEDSPPQKSLKDFRAVIKRLISNRIFMLNTFSTVFFVFGYSGYWTFMPKYIETMFRQTASWANFFTGSVALIFTVLGTIASGKIIHRYKPSAQKLAAWNVFIEVLDVLGYGSWAFLGCPTEQLHGMPTPNGSWNLTAPCNAECVCASNIKYAPVCSLETSTNFYSPCHAGCSFSYFSNQTKIFSDCTCTSGGTVMDGICPNDCSLSFTIFLLMQSVLKFLQATGKTGNILIQLRSVEEADKPMSITLREFIMSILVYIPAPIIYGRILDSVCIVWGESCGQSGNCWLYDGHALRYLHNFTTAAFLACGLALDIGVWHYSKGLTMYDDKKESKNDECDERGKESLQELEPLPTASPRDTVSSHLSDTE